MEDVVYSETVSVIIPVYNSERYLDRCIEGVLRQSYRELDVLLIDDGSTDGSGAICDRWAEKDVRIRVIHKENGGVAKARNTGLDAAVGEYISFVDSDDYTSVDMIQNLFQALKANDADISICNIQYVDETGLPLGDVLDSPIRDEVLTGQKAIEKMSDCEHRGWYYLFLWNKLYKKSVFSGIRFPGGKISEEDFVAHKLFMRCQKVVSISAVGYYYVQRTQSIVHGKSPQLFLNRAEGCLERAIACDELGLYRSAGQSYWLAAVSLPDALIKNGHSFEACHELDEALQVFRNHINFRKYCTKKERLQILMVFLSPKLYQTVFRSSLWKHSKQRLGRIQKS